MLDIIYQNKSSVAPDAHEASVTSHHRMERHLRYRTRATLPNLVKIKHVLWHIPLLIARCWSHNFISIYHREDIRVLESFRYDICLCFHLQANKIKALEFSTIILLVTNTFNQ